MAGRCIGLNNLHSMSPPNIRLDEDILKTSFVFVFRTCLQDVLIKANIFALVIRLQKTPSRHLQDVLVKTNIFVLTIRLQDVFKTSSRRFQDVFKTSSRRFQDVFKTSSKRLQDVLQKRLQDFFKTSSRRLAKMFSSRFQHVSLS